MFVNLPLNFFHEIYFRFNKMTDLFKIFKIMRAGKLSEFIITTQLSGIKKIEKV